MTRIGACAMIDDPDPLDGRWAARCRYHATGGRSMPLFLVERHFAEEFLPTADGFSGIREINDEVGVQWIFSFLSADKRKTYCLYEASSAEALREAAKRAGVPADVIVEVSQLHPDMFSAAATAAAASAG
jgi:hypothetical protein